MPTIRLPRYAYEDSLPGLLEALWQPLDDDPLIIDFSHCIYYIPAAVTILITRIDHAMRAEAQIELRGLEECQNFQYLQRIDFFDQLGLKLEENFVRRSTGNAFVPLREIVPANVSFRDDPVATDLAKCVANGETGDLFLLSQYALGEIIANLRQHAGQRGFVCAQYSPGRGQARIGIADAGMGIRESFRANNAPYYQPEMNDLQVLELAMSAWRSSKSHLRTGAYGEPSNRGVGLTMVRTMVAESYGQFFLASGNAWWFRNGTSLPRSGFLPEPARVQGTIVSATYARDQVDNYIGLRRLAWNALGLTQGPDTGNLFG